QESGKAINEKIRLYVNVGQALISAKAEGRDPFQAIEQIVPWQKFTQSVSEAEKLARPEDFDYLDLVGEGWRYAPTFLAGFGGVVGFFELARIVPVPGPGSQNPGSQLVMPATEVTIFCLSLEVKS